MMHTHTRIFAARPITALLILLSLVVSGAAGAAQPGIEASAGLRVYEQVEGWVRDWDIPSVDAAESASEPLTAVVVTLRLDGRVFGRGAAAAADPDTGLVWQAASEALNAANSKLTQERDAMWEAFIRELSERITITVEIGDELIPISKSELALPGFGYSPGSVGFVVRRGENTDAVGAGAILVRRGDPARSAAALCLTLSENSDLVMQSPADLSEQGFTFYRWVPMTIAQPAPGLGGVFIDRGGRVIDESEISVRAIRTMSDRIATHLMGRRWEGVEAYGFTGTLDPVTGKVDSPYAGPFEQALGAYALLRYGADASTQQERDAVVAGREVLRALGDIEDDEITPWDDPIAASMTLIALSEIPLELIIGEEGLSTLRVKSLETLDTLYDTERGFDPIIPAAAKGLIAHALVVSAKLDPRDRTGAAESAIARVYLDTPAELLVSQMPFLAWAQIEHTGAEGELASTSALRQMRELVWEHQLARADLAWIDRDLAGGIVFTRSKAPLPSWSCLRPLAAMATMLGDERITPGSISSGDVPSEMIRLIRSIRFVRQLIAEGETMHMYADAREADWGVRMALWDQRMPIESGAMALLMLSETRSSLDGLMGR